MNAKLAVRLMKDISSYGFEYLQNSHFKPKDMTDKQVLVMAYFTHAQAHYDGVISLVCKSKSQPATAHLQVRALQETWINVRLMTCVKDETWSNYLNAVSESERLKTVKRLLGSNLISSQEATKITKEANFLVNKTKTASPLPDIDKVMYPSKNGRDFYGKQKLTLREMCQIIDYYEPTTGATTMTQNYDVVYKFLSQYTHQDARTVLSVVREENSEYVWDIGGSSDDILKVMGVAYNYYAGCLHVLTEAMGNTDERRFEQFNKRFDKHLR